MRRSFVAGLAGAILLLSLYTQPASAYFLALVPTTWTTVSPGELVSFDVYLDTQGVSGISFISVSFTYDADNLLYRPDLSDAEDYYPLYAPGSSSKDGGPPT